jgi:hypothetical protein
MDETQIAQQVAQNIPQEPVVSDPGTSTSETPTPEQPFHSNVPIDDMGTLLRVSDAFGLGRTEMHSQERQAQMREVVRLASEKAQSNDIGRILQEITAMEIQLGIVYKPDRLARLARWASIERQTQALRVQQEMIRHG